MSDEAVAWLRQQIEGDKALAFKAGHPDGTHMRWAHLYGVVVDADDEDYAITLDSVAEILDHVARHDPQDVIADCEAKLAILDEHPAAADDGGHCARCQNWVYAVAAPWPCTTLRCVASSYRHRPGFAEHWGELHIQA